MNEIPKIIESGEKSVWFGGPKFSRFILHYVIWDIFLILIFFYFGAIFFLNGILSLGIYAFGFSSTVALLYFLSGLLSYRATYYGITDKRVLFQSGIIG